MRNLVFIHLESLNRVIYQTNKRLFPNLDKWERKSVSFSRYFSTATSTLMVVSDMAYGGMLQNEPCDSMISGLKKYCYESSLLDDLQKKGYQVHVADYPAIRSSNVGSCNERHFIGHEVTMKELQSSEECVEFLDHAMNVEKPFVLWLCNFVGNVTYYRYLERQESQTGMDLWENSYISMDRYVGELLCMLETKGLVENTTIVFYGDHGADFFSHGRHLGLLHAIEPYAALIHTPFWIYDTRLEAEETDSLIDTTDIRSIVEALMNLPDQVDEKLKLEEVSKTGKSYSIARNCYAAQRLREQSLHKGYSITDGKFLLLAGDQGMELYHMDMDAACQHNLLDYFDFDGESLSLNKRSYNRMKFHIKAVIDQAALLRIEQLFGEFREQLMKCTDQLYQYAECKVRNLEVDFNSIHYGSEERERRKLAELKAPGVVAEIINHFLNHMQLDQMAAYGDAGDEIKGIYPAITIHKIVGLRDECPCDVIYISVDTLEELVQIKPWIESHRETVTMFAYVKNAQDADVELEAELAITYKCHNPELLKGKLYFIGKVFEYPSSLTVPAEFRVLAVMHFYNEADILGKTIEYLLSQEVDVYLADNWSDDGSYEIAQGYREKHPDHIFLERFPDTGASSYYDWYHQLQRTEEIAVTTNYDWYIHYDADEMRVGPWKGKNLRESIYYIDQLGFNAIDNLVIDFKLTQDDDRDIFMSDTYFAFRHSPMDFWHRKTWKKTDKVDIKTTGGHIAKIENPKLFPLKILNRHYPWRSMEQAYRKVFVDRKPRFEKEQKERGWHGHYNDVIERKDLLTDQRNLILWDETVWEKYYISLFLGCGIQLDNREEFDLYTRYLEGKRVVLYGAGNYGKYFCEEMAESVDIVAWVDKNAAYLPWFCGRSIQTVETIKQLEFDFVFIAVVKAEIKQEIKEKLMQMGIPEEKIF